MITNVTPAKYFANRIFKSEIGRVKSNSIVPVLLSSAIERIVIAGIKIKKIKGAKLKNGIKSASVPSNRFVYCVMIQWNNPEVIRKMSIKIYPITELKKLRISLKYSARINFYSISSKNNKTKGGKDLKILKC